MYTPWPNIEMGVNEFEPHSIGYGSKLTTPKLDKIQRT